jgi:pantetheine-phosphate adenylyltransferase
LFLPFLSEKTPTLHLIIHQNIYLMKIAVFPGSFDPITTGHVDLVRRALPLFDQIIVAVGVNSTKKYLFPLEDRLKMLEKVFAKYPTVKVDHFENLTAHYCNKIGARYLLRGLRNASDFDYEKTISQLNHIVGEGIETVFLISQPEFSHISSTIVREIIVGGADARQFIPKEIQL